MIVLPLTPRLLERLLGVNIIEKRARGLSGSDATFSWLPCFHHQLRRPYLRSLCAPPGHPPTLPPCSIDSTSLLLSSLRASRWSWVCVNHTERTWIWRSFSLIWRSFPFQPTLHCKAVWDLAESNGHLLFMLRYVRQSILIPVTHMTWCVLCKVKGVWISFLPSYGP